MNDKETQGQVPTDSPALAPTGSYVVAGGGTLEVGKEYICKNQRKGEFRMQVVALRGEWIDGVITRGEAKAMMSYNVRGEGEEITVRDSHSYFIPVGKTT